MNLIAPTVVYMHRMHLERIIVDDLYAQILGLVSGQIKSETQFFARIRLINESVLHTLISVAKRRHEIIRIDIAITSTALVQTQIREGLVHARGTERRPKLAVVLHGYFNVQGAIGLQRVFQAFDIGALWQSDLALKLAVTFAATASVVFFAHRMYLERGVGDSDGDVLRPELAHVKLVDSGLIEWRCRATCLRLLYDRSRGQVVVQRCVESAVRGERRAR